MATCKHVLVRLYLYLLFVLFFITGGLAMFVLAPLYKGAFAPKAGIKDLEIFRIWGHVYKIIWRSISDKSYRDMYSSKITDPPKTNTSLDLVRIKDTWEGNEGDCDACKNSCCVQLGCPLMAKSGRCLSYDSLFFNYFFCGRYPENQSQIDYYDCPKWEVRKAKSEV